MEDMKVQGDDGQVFSNVVELANGCLCCTVVDDFVAAVEKLVEMQRFQYILVECSGLADPGVSPTYQSLL